MNEHQTRLLQRMFLDTAQLLYTSLCTSLSYEFLRGTIEQDSLL